MSALFHFMNRISSRSFGCNLSQMIHMRHRNAVKNMDYHLSQTLQPPGHPNVRRSILHKHRGLLQRGAKILCFSPFPPCGKNLFAVKCTAGDKRLCEDRLCERKTEQNEAGLCCVAWGDRCWQIGDLTDSIIQSHVFRNFVLFFVLNSSSSSLCCHILPCLFSAPPTFHLSGIICPQTLPLSFTPPPPFWPNLYATPFPHLRMTLFSLSVRSNSTFPDVRRLLHHWDKQAFSCDYLAFNGKIARCVCVGEAQ